MKPEDVMRHAAIRRAQVEKAMSGMEHRMKTDPSPYWRSIIESNHKEAQATLLAIKEQGERFMRGELGAEQDLIDVLA